MKVLRYWLPAIVWMGIIFILSGRESTRVSDTQLVNFLFFKMLHVIEYGALFTLYARALKLSYPVSKGVNFFAVSFLLTLLYAVTDEIHQLFIPTREGRVRDVIIDAIGAALAWYMIARFLPKAPQKLKALAKSWHIPFS